MEIRRAILLFAIVLGLAALVTSVTRSGDEEPETPAESPSREPPRTEASPPAASAEPAPGSARLRFPAGANPVTRELRSGRGATLTIEVLAPGQVSIDDLGLDASAQPGTPARFDVLAAEPGRYAIAFTPANGAAGRTIGRLRVRE